MGVLPEIVDPAMIQTAEGNAVAGVQDLQHAVIILLIARIGLEDSQRFPVLVAHPGQRLGPVHLFQPGIGIILCQGVWLRW